MATDAFAFECDDADVPHAQPSVAFLTRCYDASGGSRTALLAGARGLRAGARVALTRREMRSLGLAAGVPSCDAHARHFGVVFVAAAPTPPFGAIALRALTAPPPDAMLAWLPLASCDQVAGEAPPAGVDAAAPPTLLPHAFETAFELGSGGARMRLRAVAPLRAGTALQLAHPRQFAALFHSEMRLPPGAVPDGGASVCAARKAEPRDGAAPPAGASLVVRLVLSRDVAAGEELRPDRGACAAATAQLARARAAAAAMLADMAAQAEAEAEGAGGASGAAS